MKIEALQPNLKVYHSDDIAPKPKGLKVFGQRVPKGTDVKGAYFDGYPQIIKEEESQPAYSVNVEKDVMVPMRDSVRLATDIYRPDVEGKKFPVLLAFFGWGKELQETAR